MRKTLFLISKFLSRFLNKLIISRYSTMIYNNVTFYIKVLFWLKTCKQQQQKYIKNIQDQAEQMEKSSRLCQLQYRKYATYTRVSLYL